MRSLLQSIAHRLGYQVNRLHSDRLGRFPFHDMQHFVQGEAPPLILDVGANEGQTVHRFRESFPGCVIHSFEPGVATFKKLQASIAHEAGVHAWNCALGSAVGRQTFLENTNSDMSSFLELHKDGWGSVATRETVEVTTVDEFLTAREIDHVDILKSDTQGYDLEVFKGADRAMRSNRIGLIYTELIFSEMYAGIPPFDELYRYLSDHGFRLVSIYEFEHQNKLAGWADALFVNPRYPRFQT